MLLRPRSTAATGLGREGTNGDREPVCQAYLHRLERRVVCVNPRLHRTRPERAGTQRRRRCRIRLLIEFRLHPNTHGAERPRATTSRPEVKLALDAHAHAEVARSNIAAVCSVILGIPGVSPTASQNSQVRGSPRPLYYRSPEITT